MVRISDKAVRQNTGDMNNLPLHPKLGPLVKPDERFFFYILGRTCKKWDVDIILNNFLNMISENKFYQNLVFKVQIEL